MKIGEMRDPQPVELWRQPRNDDVENAKPYPARFEPSPSRARARERKQGRDDDRGGGQISSFSRTDLTETTWRLNFSSDSCRPAATPTSCERCRIGMP